MATGLKSRIIYKEHTEEGKWEGDYLMLIRPKTMPSPLGTKNMVDVSTLEDLMEVQEEGRRAAASVEVQGAMEKKYLDDLYALEGKKLDIMNLYGTDGLGSIAKYVYCGTASVSPDEASDDHLTMTATIAVSTVPELVTDDYTVTEKVDENGVLTGFTVAKVGA